MVSLRDHLRPEQNGAIGLAEAAERRGERLWILCRVGVEPDRHELRQLRRELPLEPLRPGADPRELDRAAGGTGLRRRLRVAAVVAAQLPSPCSTRATSQSGQRSVVAAGPAVQRGRDTAAVQEQDRLPALLLDRAELLQQRRRERIARLAAQVDHPHAGQRAAESSAELEALEPAPSSPGRGVALP